MPLPEGLIEQIRQRVDLVELVSEVVALKRVGRNYAGLCPFHSEETPSFFVHPERGIFKCFGCGKGGNAITFVMEYYRMGFLEAVRFLAQRIGITLPTAGEEEEARKESHEQLLLQALQAAARFYTQMLTSAEGAAALQYAYRRGLRMETLQRFSIGYAPERWDALLQYLRERGFHEAVLEKAGLVVRSERGQLYDRFRHRLMFPIYDAIGRVVGFGARRLREEEATPKYLNSPTTPVYDKSRLLYGFYQARDAFRTNGYAVLVEGYLDVLTLHQAGVTPVVATAGTALTVDHLRLLRRYCQQLFVVYDADRAGQQATLRALELALAEGFDVHIVLLPDGEDPDSFVRAQGAEAFRLRMRHAVPFVDFVLLQYQRQGMLETPQGQAQAVRHVVRLIASIPDKLLHDFLIRRVAARFGIAESVLYEELARQRQGLHAERTLPRIAPAQPDTAPQPERARLRLFPEERQLLQTILLCPAVWSELAHGGPVEFASEEGQQLWEFLCSLRKQYDDPLAALVADMELQQSEMGQRLMEIAIVTESPSPRWWQFTQSDPPDERRLLRESLLRLRLRRIEEQLQRLRQLYGQHGSWDEQRQFLRQLQELLVQRQQLVQQLTEDTAWNTGG